jgi:hypothetical protein
VVGLGEGSRAIGVTERVCTACRELFQNLAQMNRRGYVIVDPDYVNIFFRDGRLLSLHRGFYRRRVLEAANPEAALADLLRRSGH